jgi:hypothetical protein
MTPEERGDLARQPAGVALAILAGFSSVRCNRR